ncbi:uncharacterized protein LAESUDRAFT_715384 [Laetiporus sulphureus 93-53]|uniref:Uncharacterized protein n=1 Tax=Laetiporus sulphureus 93-53 TaxID=1314785 RepID=A0A165DGW4_9APHY|nr:uncharacterized protein LAESUDRAFT_715384 [Laetiporus sulphureus 93-53]KZT04852.1 hypothetical protein LAESUDRAFT_715384 [Laetiporus sulphureus 93-53]
MALQFRFIYTHATEDAFTNPYPGPIPSRGPVRSTVTHSHTHQANNKQEPAREQAAARPSATVSTKFTIEKKPANSTSSVIEQESPMGVTDERDEDDYAMEDSEGLSHEEILDTMFSLSAENVESQTGPCVSTTIVHAPYAFGAPSKAAIRRGVEKIMAPQERQFLVLAQTTETYEQAARGINIKQCMQNRWRTY